MCMADKQECVSLNIMENRNLPLSLTVSKAFFYPVTCFPVNVQVTLPFLDWRRSVL